MMKPGLSSARRRGRGLSDAERSLWQAAMRDVVPINGKSAPPVADPPPPLPSPPSLPAALPPSRPMAAAPVMMPAKLPAMTYARTPGIDRRTTERLKRGQMPIEATIDLHGMTQSEAHAALNGFIARAFGRGLRALLVITGKGLKPRRDADDPWYGVASGILKTETPRWLNEAPNRARILAYTEAHPRHGGAGALYILLRRAPS